MERVWEISLRICNVDREVCCLQELQQSMKRMENSAGVSLVSSCLCMQDFSAADSLNQSSWQLLTLPNMLHVCVVSVLGITQCCPFC